MSFQVEIDKKIKDGSIYFVGDALPPDWYAAFKIWSALATQGDVQAQLNTGWCYLYGEGIDGDRDKSKAWLQKAAAQDCPKANWYLSRDYFGTDERTRTVHFEKAVSLGEKLALKHSKELQKNSDDEKKKLAQQQAVAAYQVLFKDIIKAFDGEDYPKAKLLLDGAIAQGHVELANVRAAFDVTLEKISVKKQSQKGELVSGGVVSGTTQIYQEWRDLLEVSYTVRNQSTYPATVSLRTLDDAARGNGNARLSLGTIPLGIQEWLIDYWARAEKLIAALYHGSCKRTQL